MRMIKTLLLLIAVVMLAALTSCGVKKELYLPEGQKRDTVF